MSKPINVLSIDGGGIRGIISAEILIYVEKKLQEITNSHIKLSEHFDLIVGTSTGGILTCIYAYPDEFGKPKYTAEDASKLYLENGGKIFEKEFTHRIKTLFGIFGPKFRPNNMETLFDNYFGNTKLSKSTTNIMLTSVNSVNNDLYLFKSYKARKEKKHNFKLSDAARSSSAAPTYFPPKKLMLNGEEMSLIDGGMAINNPSISAYIEAKKIFPKSKKVNLLSIGTGTRVDSHSYNKTKKWGVLNWILPLFDLILIASSKGVQYQADLLYENDLQGNYLRVEPILNDNVDDEMSNASVENLENLRITGVDSVELYKERIDKFLTKSMEK